MAKAQHTDEGWTGFAIYPSKPKEGDFVRLAHYEGNFIIGKINKDGSYTFISGVGSTVRGDEDEIVCIKRSGVGQDTVTAAKHPPETTSHPYAILNQAAKAIEGRAEERDVRSERSMRRTVSVFNELCDTDLTEEQGWKFMVVLKLCRSAAGYNEDDYIDLAGYAALAGECAGHKDKMAKQSGEENENIQGSDL